MLAKVTFLISLLSSFGFGATRLLDSSIKTCFYCLSRQQKRSRKVGLTIISLTHALTKMNECHQHLEPWTCLTKAFFAYVHRPKYFVKVSLKKGYSITFSKQGRLWKLMIIRDRPFFVSVGTSIGRFFYDLEVRFEKTDSLIAGLRYDRVLFGQSLKCSMSCRNSLVWKIIL